MSLNQQYSSEIELLKEQLAQKDKQIRELNNQLSAIPRLCAQLRGHVDFLTRLASSPKLQSLFLISDHNGSVFLPETARQLLLEQAARTTKLISSYPQILDSEFDQISTINSSISIENKPQKFDANERLQNLKKFLSNNIQNPDELSSLLLQETMISSSLQNIASNANDKLKQISNCLKKAAPFFGKTQKDSKFEIEEEEEEFGEDQNFGDDFDYDFENALRIAKKVAKFASQNQEKFNHENGRLSSSDENQSPNYSSSKYQQSIVSNKYTRNVRSENHENSSSNDWLRWAKTLYHSLTQLPADSQDEAGLRIAIEEAALTSIGTQVLQNKLKSLRIQKSVMKQPVVPKQQNEIKFLSTLICVASCVRIIKSAYASNAYSTKRKASQWSRKTVLNE